MTSTVLPAWARAAATLTVVVVLPTPPFWFATVMTRVWAGRGTVRPLSVIRLRASAATAAAKGVWLSAPGIAAAIWARSSVSSWVGASMRSSRVPAGVAARCCIGRHRLARVGDLRVGARLRRCSLDGQADVSRETRSGAGQPNGVVAGPDRRGKPRPGAAVRRLGDVDRRTHAITFVVEQGRPNTTSRCVNTPKRHGAGGQLARRTATCGPECPAGGALPSPSRDGCRRALSSWCPASALIGRRAVTSVTNASRRGPCFTRRRAVELLSIVRAARSPLHASVETHAMFHVKHPRRVGAITGAPELAQAPGARAVHGEHRAGP